MAKKFKKTASKKKGLNRKYKMPGGKTRTMNSKTTKFSSLKPVVVSAAEGGLLKYQSPSSYAQSLIDPFRYQDVRIPDLATHPTGVYTVSADIPWSYLAPGGTVLSTAGNSFIVALGAIPFFQSILSGTAAGSGRVKGTDLAQTVRPNFSQSRLVSAGLIMRYNGNDANSTGNITCAVLSALDVVGGQISYGTDVSDSPISASAVSPFVAGTNANNFWTTQVGGGTALGKVRNSYFGPVVDGCRMTYRPLDSDDFGMRTNDCLATFDQAITHKQCANVAVFGEGEDELSVLAAIPHYFIVNVSGVPSGSAPSFNISLSLNYEGIPKDDSIGVPLSGVYCNPASQAYGLNMAANTRQCTSSTTYEVSKVDKMVRSL